MPLIDKVLIDENYEATALLGLCDVTLSGETFENERIRLDLNEGVVRVEATKFSAHRVPVGRPLSEEFLVSNVRIQSRGTSLQAESLAYTFISSVGGGSFDIANTSLANVTGFHSRPASISLVCNNSIEFVTDTEAFERRFFLSFNFHQINLSPDILLSGSKSGFSILGEQVFLEKNVDNAVAIVVGARAGWATEWQGTQLRIRLNAYKGNPVKIRPIMSTGEEWVSLDITRQNAETLFPMALNWLNSLEKEQLTKALIAIDSLLSARTPGQNYLLSLFGVFRFWEWADNAKTLSRDLLAQCLNISRDEADALVNLRNDLIHGSEFFKNAVEKCDTALKHSSETYVDKYEMGKPAASVLNYAHTISADALMRVIGFEGSTNKYFPISGTARTLVET